MSMYVNEVRTGWYFVRGIPLTLFLVIREMWYISIHVDPCLTVAAGHGGRLGLGATTGAGE